MSRYTFIYSSDPDDGEDSEIEMTLMTQKLTHHEVTEFYGRFLQAIGFVIGPLTEPDLNELANDHHSFV